MVFDWPSAMCGFIIGAVLFDGMWRLTMIMIDKLVNAQNEYIDELRKALELDE